MPTPIRCIHVITRLILGGAQENTLLTMEGLGRLPEYRSSLVTGPTYGPEGELVQRAREHKVDLIEVPSLVRQVSPRHDWAAYRALVRLFRVEKPQIVHTHSGKAGILGRLAAARAGVPVIIHTVHGPSFWPDQNFMANLLYRKLETYTARRTTRLISVADAMTDQYVAAGVAPREKFNTIYSGMEVEPFLRPDGARDEIRRALNIPADAQVIGKVARLFHLKGHEDVLRAFAEIAPRFPKAHLLFVGDGILRDSLKQLAADLGIADRLHLAGLVPPERVADMIKAMDVLVHASLREGLARVLPQALLSGCPVVSYDVDGAREVVRPNETGFLVTPRSVGGLAKALESALTDLPYARRMALHGRELFADQFRAETMVRRIVGVYDQELLRAGVSRNGGMQHGA